MNRPAGIVSLRLGLASAAALLFAACAGGQKTATGGGSSSGGGAGQLSAGMFTPGGTPATTYGGAPKSCPPSQVLRYMAADLGDLAKQAQKTAPQAEARLCAMAEALLNWPDGQRVADNVAAFLAYNYGLVNGVVRTPRIVLSSIDVEGEKDLANRLEEVLMQYVRQVPGQVRYGIASGRGATAATKVVLVMQEPQLELDEFPRKLDVNGEAKLSGKLISSLTNPKVILSDPKGKLQQPDSKPGKDLSVPVSCGGNKGRIAIEIRGEEGGQPALAAAFPVWCGIDPPTSVRIASGGDPAQQERAIFEAINAERSEAGIAPLTWDDKVSQVAREASEADAKGGGGAGLDVVQRLKDLGVGAPVVLQNPGAALTSLGAHDRFSLSPVHRANYMNTDATRAGVGMANGTQNNVAVVYLNELFVKQVAQVNLASVAPRLREAINKRRASAGVLKDDPLLDKVAQEYADALAAASGNITDAKHSQLVTPLYKNFRTVDFLSGAKVDPLEFADEKTVVTAKEKAMGIGVAQGNHPALGKNATYVVVLFGTRK